MFLPVLIGKNKSMGQFANNQVNIFASYLLTPRRGEVLLLRTRSLRYIQAGGGDGGDVAANARILIEKIGFLANSSAP